MKPKKHRFQCCDCGSLWYMVMENENRYGTIDPCPECLSVLGSFHDCCQGKELPYTAIQILKRGADEKPMTPKYDAEELLFKELEAQGLIALYDGYRVTYAGMIYFRIGESGIGLDDGAIRSLYDRELWGYVSLALIELQDDKLIVFDNETGMYQVNTDGTSL